MTKLLYCGDGEVPLGAEAVTPDELFARLRDADCAIVDRAGLVAEVRAAGFDTALVLLGDDVAALDGSTELATRDDLALRVRAAIARASAPPHRRIVETTDEGVWLIDANAVTTYANPGMARMLGYSIDELIGTSALALMDPASRATAYQNKRRREAGIAESLELVFVRKDGRPLYAALTTNPLFVDGAFAGVLAIATDIGASEQRFRSLFEHSPSALWEEDASELKRHFDALRARGITDMRSYFKAHPDELIAAFGKIKVLDVNQAALRHYEAPDKATLIAGLMHTITPESYAVMQDELIAFAENELIYEAETTDQTLTGKRHHILLRAIVAPGSEHTFARVYVSMVDITALKQAALFPQLNPNPVLELDAAGAIEYANPAAQALADSLGVTLAQMLPDDRTGVRETRHGARTLAWSFHQVPQLGAMHCYVVDITKQLMLEEQLRQAQKMEAVGQLAGGVAHDFNNLLTVIYGATAMLQRTRPSESLDAIAAAAERAAALVRQLLAFSRQQVLAPKELELNATVKNLVRMLERVVREDIEVTVELADQPVWTRADANMLDQVVMNLVVNARDAMPDGGRLVLTTAIAWISDEVPELAPGAYATLVVRDTGLGIAAENLARIFDPFFTTKEQGKGTGLGLATAFGIVKQHGGALVVASEVGRGTAFTLYLPEVAAVEPVAPSPPPALHRGAESILLVEDEAPVRRLIQRVLEQQGYRVQVVSSGAEALEVPPAYDLLLTDVVMPGGISGRELAERLLAARPALRVMFMSGHTFELASRGLALIEGENFLQKPFGPAPLLACVRRALDRHVDREKAPQGRLLEEAEVPDPLDA